ncbi:hypothetical protein AB205_0065630, partial [Aquarana catesbeiana]
VASLQTRWKGLRDCFKHHLRRLHECRSGSGSKTFVPYVHAEELQFLRPFMELRETQSSWEERDHGQRAGGEAACAVEGGSQCRSAHQSLEATQDTQETNISEPSPQLELPEVQLPQIALPDVEQPQVEEPPTQRPLPQRSSRLIGGRINQTMDHFATLMEKLDRKLDALETEESGFGSMVEGMLKKVPQDRKNFVKKAVMDILEANMLSDPATDQSPIFAHPPPPSGPYYGFPNPPLLPPSLPSIHGRLWQCPKSMKYPIPYPSLSPITLGAPGNQRFGEESFQMPPTPSPKPSTSSTLNQLTYHQL